MSEPADPVFKLFRTEKRPDRTVFWFKYDIDPALAKAMMNMQKLYGLSVHKMNIQTEHTLRQWAMETFDDPQAIGVLYNEERVVVTLVGKPAATAFRLRFG